MALFKDDNNQRYLGIHFLQSDDMYSGNFIKISERVFQRMLVLHRLLIRFMLLLIALTLCVFFYRLAFNPVDAFRTIYIYLAGMATAALVLYAMCTYLLIFSKVKIKNKKMHCIARQSVEIYLIMLLGMAGVFLNVFLYSTSVENIVLVLSLFTLLPLAIFCCIAIFHYRKN